jgi:hypothetical protein
VKNIPTGMAQYVTLIPTVARNGVVIRAFFCVSIRRRDDSRDLIAEGFRELRFLARRFFTVRFTKNGTSRNVPIYEVPMLQWSIDHRHAGQVQAFVYSDGRPVTFGSFYGGWHAASATSGIDYFIPHDSRRSSIRKPAKEGVPQARRMKLHGWKTDDVDHRRGVVDTADVEIVRKLIDSRRHSETTANGFDSID